MDELALCVAVESIMQFAAQYKEKEKRTDLEEGALIGLAEALTVLREACPEEVRSKVGLEKDPDSLIFG